MAAVPLEVPTQDSPRDPSLDWERFYQNYRKPGYVPGYEILHKLGGGVFGIVFKARKESIGKAYAIKFLKVDDASVKEQVLRELETVSLFAQVDHPNLVSIEDKGLVDGIPYIIMGYAGEETLKTRLEEARLSEEDAFRIFVQVLRGVQALHEHSLIHFDLKPANIFLKGEIARVGDYGLSKLVCESKMSLSFGRGTPYYMAPEMLQRKGDHRSDIYSLGIIFFECLTGVVPFTGENEWEVLKGHEEKEIEFPDSLPRTYRTVLERMLCKDADARYQGIDEVLQDLKAPGALGESIILEYGSQKQKPTFGSRAEPTSRSASSRSDEPSPPPLPATRRERQRSADQELPGGLISSLLRALVIALLLPARVLGLGLGRTIQIVFSWPFAILSFIGKVSVFFLGGIAIALIIGILIFLLSNA